MKKGHFGTFAKMNDLPTYLTFFGCHSRKKQD